MTQQTVYHVLESKKDYDKIIAEGLKPLSAILEEKIKREEKNKFVARKKGVVLIQPEVQLNYERQIDSLSEKYLPPELKDKNIKRLNSFFAFPQIPNYQDETLKYILEIAVNPTEVYAFNQALVTDAFQALSEIFGIVLIGPSFTMVNEKKYWQSGMLLEKLFKHEHISSNIYYVKGKKYVAEVLIPENVFQSVKIVGLRD